MAITGYAGKPGHGKSYEVVVYQVYHAVKNRRHIVTNIPLILENFAKVDPIFEAPEGFVIPDCRSKSSVMSDIDLQALIISYRQPQSEKQEQFVQPEQSSDQPEFKGIIQQGWSPPPNLEIPIISKSGFFKTKPVEPPQKSSLPPKKKSIVDIEKDLKTKLGENPEPAGDTWINPWHYVHFVEDTADSFAFQTRMHYGVLLETKFGFSLTTEKGEGALYVIDECQRALPVSETSSEVENFYQLHRHYGISIVLITQNFKVISTKIQVLIEDVVTLSKNHIFGSPKSYLRFHHAGLGGPFINKQVRSYIPKYFLFYKSYTQGGQGEAGKVDFASIWSRPVMIVIILVLALALSFIIYLIFFGPSFNDLINGNNVDKKTLVEDTADIKPQSIDLPKPSQLPKQPVSVVPPATPATPPPPIDPLTVAGFTIHQGGFGSLVLVSDSQDKIPSPPKNLTTYLLVKSNNSQVIQISSADMIRMGYKIKTELKCYSVLEYRKKDQVRTIEVSCDIPPLADSMQTVAPSGKPATVRH